MPNAWTRPFRHGTLWGLQRVPAEAVRARRVERRWHWPLLLTLASTVPAFYIEMLHAHRAPLASLAYLLGALTVAAALLHTARHSGAPARHVLANPLDLALALGLLAAAALPPSSNSTPALVVRLLVALATLVRMVWAVQHLLTRGSLANLLVVAGIVLLLCGAGYWWLEPTTPTFADGLWLAFATAATVGYGDVVPTTPAAKIFSVFVVMLGFGVLTMVTAAIATKWVETEERIIEREILRDVHHQMDALRRELAALREELHQGQVAAAAAPARTPEMSHSQRA